MIKALEIGLIGDKSSSGLRDTGLQSNNPKTEPQTTKKQSKYKCILRVLTLHKHDEHLIEMELLS